MLLINPGNRNRIFQGLNTAEFTSVEPPVFAGLFATYLRNKGASVEIYDASALGASPKEIADVATKVFNPTLVVLVMYGAQPSASTQHMTAAGEIANAIKESRNVPILMTGGHPAALPQRTMEEENIDFVCDLEGPVTIWKTLQALKAGITDFSSIPSLWWFDRQANQIRSPTAAEPLIVDLDSEMPGIAWDLLPMHLYRSHNWHSFDHIDQRSPYAAIHTSLGCPHRCGFCLREGTEIITASWPNKKIENLKVGDKLLAWDEKNRKISETEIVKVVSRKVRSLLRIRTSSGQSIDVTTEHPIYTGRGWINAGELTHFDKVLVMDKKDKVSHIRRRAMTPELRAELSEKMKVHSKISSARMKRLHKEGKIPHGCMTLEARLATSERMKKNNPMYNPVTAKKVSVTFKARIASGQIKLFAQTAKGKKIISKAARKRMLSNKNPMKDPRISRSPELLATRSRDMKELWADPERVRDYVKNRPVGEDHHCWKGGISRFPYLFEFNEELKQKIKERDGFECLGCGSKDNLVIHHINYAKDNLDDCNLVTVCGSCNVRANYKREYWEEFYTGKMLERGHFCPSFEKIISITELYGTFTVYNFECGPYDNYWAERLLVHNCMINAPYGKPAYRMWSPATVMKEIDLLTEKYGVVNLKFVDEMFVLNKAHVMELCGLLAKRPYKVNIWAYARVDTVQDQFLDALKAAGVNWLCLGIESASNFVRDGALKKYSNKDIIDVVGRIRAAGIHVIGNYIFGLPDDTHERMQQTLDLALELNCEFANFYSAMAYPGSALYKQAVAEKRQLPEKWEDYSQHGYGVIPLANSYCTSEEILRFRDEAFHRYFTNPSYLHMIKHKFGPKVVEHINRMVKVPLKRKILGD